MTKKSKIFIGLAVALIVAQFIKPNRSIPEYNEQEGFHRIHNSDRMATDLFKHACYDCHSYEREYPWYADIAPLSWWIQGHVNGGSANVNFSIWGQYSEKKQIHKLQESIEKIEAGHMPPKSFKWMHPEANWTPEQKELVLSFLKSI